MRTKTSLSCLFLLLALAGCDDTDPTPSGPAPGQTGGFESDLPFSRDPNGGAKGESAGARPASASDDASESNTLSGNDAAGRAIQEADIIQVDDDRLYTLSRSVGLTVIDATNPAQLKILGRYRELNGTPFEMYLRNGVVIAMYSGWGQYVKSGDAYQYVQTSKVLALDATNPSEIAKVGSFDVAGEVSDSRIVGDVMYVVGYQNGSCWNCEQNKPRTSLLSLNVANPRAPQQVEQLFFADDTNSYGWNRRSVTVTDKRMYVAGPEYGTSGVIGSSIQVIDISNPNGDLVEGAVIEAAGQISSRWQMDEYDGVLRVVSQFPRWWQNGFVDHPPRVQTFRVESSQSVQPLGDLALKIPPNETLQSTRFDGPRGYAITAERTDPLLTLDLSDPAHPKQAGELVMPGFVYHMEPRGTRLVGLGFDQGNPQGGLTVSLFDVTDMSAPKMLDRVNFGGDWGYLPEDQDRIHKAFRVLDDKGLILVPFSGWSDTPRNVGGAKGCPDYYYYYGSYRSGVQLVDYQGDDLTLRGAAPSRGEARRALLFGQALLTVSDEAVDSYDIADRAQPKQLGRLEIGRNVTQVLTLANGSVARLSQDWYVENQSAIDFVAPADVERSDVQLGRFDLAPVLNTQKDCTSPAYIQQAFVRGNLVHLTYQSYDYLSDGNVRTVHGLITLDASNPAQPKLLSNFRESDADPKSQWYEYYDYYSYGYVPSWNNVAVTEHALVKLEQRSVNVGVSQYEQDIRLRVIDLRDPANPKSAVLPLARDTSYSGLVADGADVLFSHLEETSNGKGRFYIDRVDLTDPSKPAFDAKLNVPGALLHYDPQHGRALTSNLTRVEVPNMKPEDCYKRFAYANFAYPNNWDGSTQLTATCTGFTQSLHMVRLNAQDATLEGTYALAENERVSSSSLDAGRVAAVITRGYGGWYGYGGVAVDCWGPCYYGGGTVSDPVELLALGGFESGALVSGRLNVASSGSDPWWGWWSAPTVHLAGGRALLKSATDLAVVELANVTAPSLVRRVPLYAYSWSNLTLSGNSVLIPLGMNGVQRIDL